MGNVISFRRKEQQWVQKDRKEKQQSVETPANVCSPMQPHVDALQSSCSTSTQTRELRQRNRSVRVRFFSPTLPHLPPDVADEPESSLWSGDADCPRNARQHHI